MVSSVGQGEVKAMHDAPWVGTPSRLFRNLSDGRDGVPTYVSSGGTGYEFGHNDDYDRTLHEMGNATLLYDDVTGYEFEEFVKKIKPDLIGSGIKEKYIFQKMGIPFRQMHSWDYSGPYHGYDGFAIFARDMDMTLNNPCWARLTPPWKRQPAAVPDAA
jgi:nitrogenase molybdenum-iron protein alpha chain